MPWQDLPEVVSEMVRERRWSAWSSRTSAVTERRL